MSGIRVMVHESWDEVTLPFEPDAQMGQLKSTALDQARVTESADNFLVKYLGAELSDQTTPAQAGIPESAALIVVRRNRRPVR